MACIGRPGALGQSRESGDRGNNTMSPGGTQLLRECAIYVPLEADAQGALPGIYTRPMFDPKDAKPKREMGLQPIFSDVVT